MRKSLNIILWFLAIKINEHLRKGPALGSKNEFHVLANAVDKLQCFKVIGLSILHRFIGTQFL